MNDRMPALLRTEDEVRDWLDSGNVSVFSVCFNLTYPKIPIHTYDVFEALKLLRPINSVQFHRVGDAVNNSKFKGAICVKPLTRKKVNVVCTVVS